MLENKIIEIYYSLKNYSKPLAPGLLGGKSGVALFYLYFAKYKNEQEPYDIGFKLIEEVIDEINSGFTYHSFAKGITGIGLVIEHLAQNKLLDINTYELLCDLDDYLFEVLINDIRLGNYDYLHGALGVGLYFLAHKSLDKSKTYLETLVNELEKISIYVKKCDSVKWQSVLYSKNGRKRYDISLSHGLASIITFLSKVYIQGINSKKAESLVYRAINYLLTQKLEQGKYNCLFPSYAIESSNGNLNSRLAWCYGDLGIATTLWQASKAFNNDLWEKEAIAILLHSTKRRDLQKNGVVDAGLCHGTAGIAHIFNRMFINTGIDEFKNTAIYWFDQTLKMAKFKDGLAGYKVWHTKKYGGVQNDPGLLEGIAGIGLALISAISDIEPAWDECLLLS